MKTYLIDPAGEELVTEIEWDGKLHSIYDLLDCHCIDAVHVINNDVIYVNDEGMLFDEEELKKRGFFTYYYQDKGQIYFKNLCGKGLWVGSGVDGEDAAPSTLLWRVKTMIAPCNTAAGLAWVEKALSASPVFIAGD